jgi:hypothetical protein
VEDFAAPINGSVDQRSWREWATIYRQEDNPLMAQFMTDAIERYDDLKHKKVLESSIEF